MDREHMDKLLSDIQQYLREEDKKKQAEKSPAAAPSSVSIRLEPPLNRPVHLELMLLIAASATAVLTIAIVLAGAIGIGGQAHPTVGAIVLLAVGGCGIFLTAALLAIWRQLTLLSQIEENTRLILANKLEVNIMLENLLKK